MNENQPQPESPNIIIRQEDLGGVWSNWAAVSHSPYEFTIDFARLHFGISPLSGIIVQRVNLSPLFVRQLIDALEENWGKYAQKALPREVGNNGDSD